MTSSSQSKNMLHDVKNKAHVYYCTMFLQFPNSYCKPVIGGKDIDGQRPLLVLHYPLRVSVRHDSINDEETVPKHPPTNMSKLHLHDAASKHRKTLTFDVSHVQYLLHVFGMLYMCIKGHLMSPTFKKLTFLSKQKFHNFSVFLLP